MVYSNTEARFAYRLFGMQVESNVSIEGLRAVEYSTAKTELALKFHSQPPSQALAGPKRLRYASVDTNSFGAPVVRLWDLGAGEVLYVDYSDGTEFWLDRELTTVWVQWRKTSSLESTLTYLLGPVFGLLLRLKGVVCLHASSVVIADQAVVIAGPEGAGKSTTAAGFAKQGFAVLSDDIAAIKNDHGDSYEAIPAYPRLNLWPASVKLLYGGEDALPAIVEDWDKKFLALGTQQSARFEECSMPLRSIYVLDQAFEASGILAVPLSQKDALIALVANTYAANLLDTQQRAQEFAFLGKLVERVPVHGLNPRRGEWNVAQLCEAIRADLQRIGTRQPFPAA
jgi:hypothetical protein